MSEERINSRANRESAVTAVPADDELSLLALEQVSGGRGSSEQQAKVTQRLEGQVARGRTAEERAKEGTRPRRL